MNTPSLFAGWAEIEWTPEPGLALLGQMHERIATHARDPLCVCACALRRDDVTAVLATVDVCILSGEFVAATQRRWQEQSGCDAHTLLIHATHTHVAPAMLKLIEGEPDADCVARVQDAILTAAQTALERAEPVELFAATGHLEQMGWNRRAMFEDGTSRMYGHSEMSGFVAMEGPRDPALPVLWTRNAGGEITGVLVNFSTHPNCMESESFYSADLPGAVRKHLKRALGGATGVLYLTGAAGNTAPSILDPHDATQPWRGESGVERSGLYLAGEAAKTIAAQWQPMADPQLSLQGTELQIPLRAWPRSGEPSYPQWEGIDYYERAARVWPQRLREHPAWPVRVNALRLGDAVVCTNPAELFVEFGLQMRAASPARVTFISELTDGYCGYVPTPLAFARGGYETWCAPTSQLAPDAGEQVVAATKRLLEQAFENR
jgi:hypothetical protein